MALQVIVPPLALILMFTGKEPVEVAVIIPATVKPPLVVDDVPAFTSYTYAVDTLFKNIIASSK